MGQSTDAIVFWGYCWDEEQRTPWKTDDSGSREDTDWEERYAARLRQKTPSDPYPEDETNKDPEPERIRAAYSAHWAARNALIKNAAVRISSHCHYDCPMPLVAIKGSYRCANRGHPVALDPELFMVQSNWRMELDDFCKLMDITPPAGQEPRWWLVSDWG